MDAVSDALGRFQDCSDQHVLHHICTRWPKQYCRRMFIWSSAPLTETTCPDALLSFACLLFLELLSKFPQRSVSRRQPVPSQQRTCSADPRRPLGSSRHWLSNARPSKGQNKAPLLGS